MKTTYQHLFSALALANDGQSPVYSDADIYHYASGMNPYRYPDIDMFSSDYIKDHYMRYDGTAEFEGGGRFAHFYANIGLSNTGDLMNFGEGKDNRTTRLNLRGNIDLRLNDWITAFVDANATFYDARGDLSSYWEQTAKLRPTSQYPLTPLIPIDMVNPDILAAQKLIGNASHIIDGRYLLGGTQSMQTNPFAAMYAAGHNKYTSRQLQFDAGVRMDLASVLKGLSFSTHFAVDYASSYNTSINDNYSVYEPQWSNVNGKDEIVGLTKYGTDKHTGTQNVSGSVNNQTLFFSAQFDYERSFGLHNVNATLLAHGYQRTITGEYHRTSNANLALQLGYNYNKTYYADFSMAAIHSAKLASGHREAVSPVGTLGWRISNERWMQGTKGWLDDLKLTASYGVVNQDLDIEKYFMYDDIFTATGTWWGWSESANSMQTSDSQRGGNPNLGFVKRKELRAGLTASLFHGFVTIDANVFNTHMDGLLTTPATIYPMYFQTYWPWPVSTFLPYMNYNKQKRAGWDVTLDLHKRFGDVDLELGATGMQFSCKNLRISENVEYDWLRSTGARIDALRGYKCLGFFASEDDVKSSAVINSNTKPGDLKYQDMNGDGKIDGKDQVVLGHWTPDFYLGLHFTAKYKGFTLFVMGTGNFGGMGIKNNQATWVYGDRKYSDIVLGRWTPETAQTATYPRLTAQGGDLNFVTSDFWTYNTDRFDLARVQLTYDLPASLFHEGQWVKGLSLYVNGNSLLTIAGERKYMETNVGSAPQTRSYTLGAKVNF